MKYRIIKIMFFMFFVVLCISHNTYANEAKDISKQVEIHYNNRKITNITDNKISTNIKISANKEMVIKSTQSIGSIYIKYEKMAQKGVLKTEDQNYYLGKNNFLHEYIKLDELSDNKQLYFLFETETIISEIYFFTNGNIPSWVQVWGNPVKESDLLLFSTHSDDEHLFFAGLLPHHIAKGYKTQVVYLTNHNDNFTRLHEQLDGLWAVGVTNYPIIGCFPDSYSETLEQAINNLNRSKFELEDIIKFQVEQIRRFKPIIIVGHDENGEYGHGQHILNTYALKEAILKAKDENYNKEELGKYGIWETPKVYLHLYPKNQIILDYDIPLDYYNGKTAYEMSKIGYSHHISQQYTWFTNWLNGKNNSYTKSSQIKTYNPKKFGLYYSIVGEDIQKDNMFENIKIGNYREQEKDNLIINDEKDSSDKNNYKKYIVGAIIIVLITYFIKTIANKGRIW